MFNIIIYRYVNLYLLVFNFIIYLYLCLIYFYLFICILYLLIFIDNYFLTKFFSKPSDYNHFNFKTENFLCKFYANKVLCN